MGFLFFIIFLVVGIAQLYVGFIGIEYHFGFIAASVSLFCLFFLRIMLPLTIGSFFGAMDVLGWEWYQALLLAAPGLLVVMPAMITSIIENRNR